MDDSSLFYFILNIFLWSSYTYNLDPLYTFFVLLFFFFFFGINKCCSNLRISRLIFEDKIMLLSLLKRVLLNILKKQCTWGHGVMQLYLNVMVKISKRVKIEIELFIGCYALTPYLYLCCY